MYDRALPIHYTATGKRRAVIVVSLSHAVGTLIAKVSFRRNISNSGYQSNNLLS